MHDYELVSKLLRYYSLLCSSKAGSGHPTSALSATDLMSVLFFHYFHYDHTEPYRRDNDRLIFSKGHASPLLYSLYKVADWITEDELLQYRTLQSPLEGHPTAQTPFNEVATGSLGMGLSYGLGMALANKIDRIENKMYVLMGDGETAEGQVWEAMEIATHYEIGNLVGIIDVNGLGQTGKTMYGHDVEVYERKAKAFGWNTKVIDGHDLDQIKEAFAWVQEKHQHPCMIVAKTVKGKGISFLENSESWHGKALDEEKLQIAVQELGLNPEQIKQTFAVQKPLHMEVVDMPIKLIEYPEVPDFKSDEKVATRKAYGLALAQMMKADDDLVVLDGETFNSTFAIEAKKVAPERFFNMFIAEQNMMSAGVGLSKMDKKVFVSSFAAFLSRTFDQIRMGALSGANIAICGSHAGVSIGEDGPSQMGLEEIAMMRTIPDSVVVYPSDAISTCKLVYEMHGYEGISYIHTTREATPLLYDADEVFELGKLKTLRSSKQDEVCIIAAGITVHEALKAHEMLLEEGIKSRVIDLFCIKPLDVEGIRDAVGECNGKVVVVEDHYIQGGIGDAVLEALAEYSVAFELKKLGITGLSHSGKPHELMAHHGIDAESIASSVRNLI